MDDIVERLKIEIQNGDKLISNDVGYKKNEIYWEELEKAGVVKKHVYNIDPLDTIGKRLFQNQNKY